MSGVGSVTAEPKSALWLALRVFDEPARVFAQLSEQPRALVPILLIALVSVGVAFGMPSQVLRSAAEQQLKIMEQRRPGGVTPDIREKALSSGTGTTARVLVAAAGTVNSLVVLAVTSGVLLLCFNGLSGAALTFRDEWSLAAHAFLPQTLGAIVTVIGVAMLEDPQFRISLGFLVGEDSSRFLHHFANQFTFFGAWSAYLLALGNQIRTRDKSIAGPFAIVGGLWLLGNLVSAGIATMFASLTG
jgi:hypothetical protein